jgi:hypothetical protein
MARPKFVPTDEQRRTVKSMSAYGIKQEGIARMLHFRSAKTLRKHFPEELILGEIEAVAQVSQTHYQMAKSGKYPASTIHFLEKRRCWLEDQSSESKPVIAPEFVVVVEQEAA